MAHLVFLEQVQRQDYKTYPSSKYWNGLEYYALTKTCPSYQNEVYLVYCEGLYRFELRWSSSKSKGSLQRFWQAFNIWGSEA